MATEGKCSESKSKWSLEATVKLEMAVRRIEELVTEIEIGELLQFCEV
jgi:hypothetical protein